MTEKDPRTMTVRAIGDELRVLEDKWRALRADDDGHGGSPCEWMSERMDELETELQRRSDDNERQPR